MKKAIILLSLVMALGCKTVPPASVITHDRSGEELLQVDIPLEGDRGEIPTGIDSGYVVAQVHTDSGSTIVITENPKRTLTDRVLGKRKYTAYLDNKAVAEAKEVKKSGGEMVTQPKAPWYKWPAIILGVLVVLAALYFMRPILEFFKVLLTMITRFRK